MKHLILKKALYYPAFIVLLFGYFIFAAKFYLLYSSNVEMRNFAIFFLGYPFLVYGVSGFIAGVFLHLIPESTRAGSWRFAWQRFAFFTLPLILAACSEIFYYHFGLNLPFFRLLFYNVSIKGVLLFVLCFSLAACFRKEPGPVPAKAKLKESAGYVVMLILMFGYHIFSVAVYNIKGLETKLDNIPVLLYMVFPLVLYGVQGVFAGVFLHLIPESSRSGKWRFNTGRAVFFGGGLLLVSVWAALYYFRTPVHFFPFHDILFNRVSVRGVLFFLLCFSPFSCFYKEPAPEPAVAETAAVTG